MKLSLCLIAVLFTYLSQAQIPDRISKKMGANPLFFLDSAEVSMDILSKLNPLDISNISIVSKKRAKKQLGEKGSDGAVYVTTVKFAKENYWKFLCSVSGQYKQLIESPAADSTVQYELNGKLLTDQAVPGELFWINEKSFKRLQVKDNSYLVRPLSCFPLRQYVIVIKAKRTKGVIKMSSFKN